VGSKQAGLPDETPQDARPLSGKNGRLVRRGSHRLTFTSEIFSEATKSKRLQGKDGLGSPSYGKKEELRRKQKTQPGAPLLARALDWDCLLTESCNGI
jgi:hypothetical protein